MYPSLSRLSLRLLGTKVPGNVTLVSSKWRPALTGWPAAPDQSVLAVKGMVWVIVMVLTVALIFLPFIPILRSVPAGAA